MTHADARELLELAAAEPNGLERLAAGDTSQSGMLAGHLADCEACREEYARLERTAALLRSNLSTLPPTDLRDRTLARVGAEGRAREPVPVPDGVSAPDRPVQQLPAPSRLERRAALRWVGSLAAALVVAAGLGWAVVARPLADEARQSTDTANALTKLTALSIAVERRADARHVALTSTSGLAAGSLTFSPSTRELVVVSTGLHEPADGSEYRCWVEANGHRTQLGSMYFLGGIAAWEGASGAIASVSPGATFGVSLAPAGGGEALPVMTGTLGGT